MSGYEKNVLIGLYLDANADNWHTDCIMGMKPRVGDRFIKMFLRSEFNKLRQRGPWRTIFEKKSELRSVMLQRDRHLDRYYFLKSSLRGLKEELQHMVDVVSSSQRSEN